MGLLSYLLWGLFTLIAYFILKTLYNLWSNAQYFKKNNVAYMGAGFVDFIKLMTGTITLVEWENKIYKEAIQHNSPIIGFSDLMSGTYGIYITDMDMMKNIYVKDFDHFVNRRNFGGTDKTNFYFSKMLFMMESEQWKGVRAKLSPSFTTGKIKRMFELFKKSSESMASYMKNHVGPQGDLDISAVFIKFTMDVIASTAFAIDSKAWETPVGQTSKFEDMGKDFQFSFKPLALLKFMFMFLAPKLADLMGLEIIDPAATKYFADIIKDVIKRRRQTGERMDDFLQLMMDAQQGILKADEEAHLVMNGGLANDKDDGSLNTNSKVTFDDDDLVANSLQFLVAGVDSTHSAVTFAVYSLMTNPEVQEKLFQEVSSKMEANGGKLTYESVLEMTYLDMVLNESMRMYAPTSRNERVCTTDYPVPGTNFTIKKGTMIVIPMYAVQFDERYFPDPDKFIPERFNKENKATRSPYAWSAFGHGPRSCIAMRFAMVQVKAVIAQLVYSFHFSPCEKTKIPIEYEQSASLRPKGGLWVKLTSR